MAYRITLVVKWDAVLHAAIKKAEQRSAATRAFVRMVVEDVLVNLRTSFPQRGFDGPAAFDVALAAEGQRSCFGAARRQAGPELDAWED